MVFHSLYELRVMSEAVSICKQDGCSASLTHISGLIFKLRRKIAIR